MHTSASHKPPSPKRGERTAPPADRAAPPPAAVTRLVTACLCQACGAENLSDRKFCASCGASLWAPCLTCGAINLTGEKFCGDCGASLERDTPATEPTRTRWLHARLAALLARVRPPRGVARDPQARDRATGDETDDVAP